MKSHKEILESLKEKVEKHKTPIGDFENQVFPKIVQTKWATEPQFHLELLKIERTRCSRGKILNEATDKTSIKLGYDDKNRIVFEERIKCESSGVYKKFIIYKDDSIWEYKYSSYKLEGIAYQIFVSGKPMIYASYEKDVQNTVDKYEYDNEKLVEIDTYSSYGLYDPQTPSYNISYNTLGDIEAIKRVDEPSDFFPNGQNLFIYKNHGYSIKSLTEIVIHETISLIKSKLKRNRSAEKKFLLILVSKAFNSDDWFPPRVIFVNPNSLNNFDLRIDEMIDFDSISFNEKHNSIERLVEGSNLLMQEIELKDKFELPLKIIIKIAKEVKSLLSEKYANSSTTENPIILALELPDDYQEDVSTILQRLYTKGEIKNVKITN